MVLAAVFDIQLGWERLLLVFLVMIAGTAGWFFFYSIFALSTRRNATLKANNPSPGKRDSRKVGLVTQRGAGPSQLLLATVARDQLQPQEWYVVRVGLTMISEKALVEVVQPFAL